MVWLCLRFEASGKVVSRNFLETPIWGASPAYVDRFVVSFVYVRARAGAGRATQTDSRSRAC